MDRAARQGFNDGAFEDIEEDTGAIVEEFFPAAEKQPAKEEAAPKPAAPAKTSLTQKLESKSLQSSSDHPARAH
ncbi:hypothetical protein D3C81_2129580 [compost metagenome]